jgi:transposase
MATDKKRTRRNYSTELKAQVLAECEVPGCSVAQVAMAHRINANIVHGWRQSARQAAHQVARQSDEPATKPQTFVPVVIAPPRQQPKANDPIEVELRRGAVTLKISWPQTASADFAAWTRELLR